MSPLPNVVGCFILPNSNLLVDGARRRRKVSTNDKFILDNDLIVSATVAKFGNGRISGMPCGQWAGKCDDELSALAFGEYRDLNGLAALVLDLGAWLERDLSLIMAEKIIE